MLGLDSRRRGVALVLGLFLVACGARGNLEVDPRGDGGTPSDAGRPPDGSRPPPPPRLDGGGPPPGACRLVERTPPTTIFRGEPEGRFRTPQVEVRAGLADLVANYARFPDSLPEARAQRSDFGLRAFEPISIASPPTAEIHTGLRGGDLGICLRNLGRNEVELWTHDAGGDLLRHSYFQGPECLGVEGNGSRWAVIQALDPGSVFGVWGDESGGLLSMPVPLIPGEPGPAFFSPRVALTPWDAGFAYAVMTGETTWIGEMPDEFSPSVRDFPEVRPTPAGPALAAWPFASRHLALAAYVDIGLTVIVIDVNSWSEVMRTPPLAFSMGEDVPAALAVHPDALIVASLNYGDADPAGGLLQVVALGPDGSEASRVTFPTERTPDLVSGGIDVATDGDSIVVHWAEVFPDASGVIVPVTRAMVLGCAL